MFVTTALARGVTRATTRSRATPVGAITLSKRLYHENIVEHYENPRNVGSLDKNDDNVGTVSKLLEESHLLLHPLQQT
jgi:hypothetical protein